MLCPKCNSKLSRMLLVWLCVDETLNPHIGGITKTFIRKRGVEISAVDWDRSVVFCSQCGWSSYNKEK